MGVLRGTGTLVSPNCVITAAHCLYYQGMEASEVTFSIGLRSRIPLAKVSSSAFYIHPKYCRDEDSGYDIGLLKIDSQVPLGGIFGQASLRYYSLSDLRSLRVNVSGYPGVKTPLQVLFKLPSYDMYTMEGPIRSVEEHRISYDLDTSGGQSGAGVWIQQDLAQPVECLAVHTTGDKINGNGAVRLNEENSEVLSDWLSKFGEL